MISYESLYSRDEYKKLIVQLVTSLQNEPGYSYMTHQQIYKEQAALAGVETGE